LQRRAALHITPAIAAIARIKRILHDVEPAALKASTARRESS
jgi:hypothetical protein